MFCRGSLKLPIEQEYDSFNSQAIQGALRFLASELKSPKRVVVLVAGFDRLKVYRTYGVCAGIAGFGCFLRAVDTMFNTLHSCADIRMPSLTITSLNPRP